MDPVYPGGIVALGIPGDRERPEPEGEDAARADPIRRARLERSGDADPPRLRPGRASHLLLAFGHPRPPGRARALDHGGWAGHGPAPAVGTRGRAGHALLRQLRGHGPGAASAPGPPLLRRCASVPQRRAGSRAETGVGETGRGQLEALPGARGDSPGAPRAERDPRRGGEPARPRTPVAAARGCRHALRHRPALDRRARGRRNAPDPSRHRCASLPRLLCQRAPLRGPRVEPDRARLLAPGARPGLSRAASEARRPGALARSAPRRAAAVAILAWVALFLAKFRGTRSRDRLRRHRPPRLPRLDAERRTHPARHGRVVDLPPAALLPGERRARGAGDMPGPDQARCRRPEAGFLPGGARERMARRGAGAAPPARGPRRLGARHALRRRASGQPVHRRLLLQRRPPRLPRRLCAARRDRDPARERGEPAADGARLAAASGSLSSPSSPRSWWRLPCSSPSGSRS